MAVRHWGQVVIYSSEWQCHYANDCSPEYCYFLRPIRRAFFQRKSFFFLWKSKNDSADGKISLVFRPFLLLALFLHLISAAITMIIGRPIYSLAFSDCIFSAPGGHFLRPPRLNIQRALYLIFLFFFFFLPKFGAKFKVVIFGWIWIFILNFQI